ncbi:hypothetical protein DL767_003713 [Monosporascus sp. MG133]|nr:hypothetical protein DL767_003713 [Monosporascus sp. MG133]
MTTIRPRRDSDLAGCVSTLRMVHSLSGYPVDGVEDAFGFLRTDDRAGPDDRSGYVALWRKLHPPGFGSGSDKDDIVVLGRLFVHTDARGGGVATRLINKAVAETRKRGARAVMLALLKDQDAIRLYRNGLDALRDYGL